MKIQYVTWRDGRPRFNPAESLRKRGHKGHDLKIGDRWMTAGETLDWSQNFQKLLDGEKAKAKAERQREKAKVAKAASQARAAVPKIRSKSSYTVGRMLEDYLQKGTAHNKPGTLKIYKIMMRNFEKDCPMVWVTEADALTRPIVIGIYDELRKSRGIHVSALIVRVLATAYKWAIDRDKVAIGNPVIQIKTQRPEPRIRSVSVVEYLHLIATADKIGLPDVADMIVWGVFTAQRTDDRLAMHKQDIVHERLEITQQKTGSRVSMPLAQPILERMGTRPAHEHETIIDLAGKTSSTRYAYYWRRWRMLIEHAAKTMPSLAGVHDQDLRDTAVSWMGRAGCTTQEIFSITGHKQQGETRILRHYMAAHNEIADNAIAKLQAWFYQQLKELKSNKPLVTN